MTPTARQRIRSLIKEDIYSHVANGELPDTQYRVALVRTSNAGLHEEQILALGGNYLRITLSDLPKEYADLDKQREVRTTLSEITDKYRKDEPFAVKVLTNGQYTTRNRSFSDLLEAAIYRATEEIREGNNGALPAGLVLESVPDPRGWVN